MSLAGFHKFAPMGYISRKPDLPPHVTIHHTLPPISAVEESTFDAWLRLPDTDLRTLDEYAANPVLHPITYEFRLPNPPGMTPGMAPIRPPFPPNRNVR